MVMLKLIGHLENVKVQIDIKINKVNLLPESLQLVLNDVYSELL